MLIVAQVKISIAFILLLRHDTVSRRSNTWGSAPMCRPIPSTTHVHVHNLRHFCTTKTHLTHHHAGTAHSDTHTPHHTSYSQCLCLLEMWLPRDAVGFFLFHRFMNQYCIFPHPIGTWWLKWNVMYLRRLFCFPAVNLLFRITSIVLWVTQLIDKFTNDK